MSLVPGSVYANDTTPCFVLASGGGGGSNPTFSNVSIVQGGSITMSSSINSNTPLVFYRDVSGTLLTEMTMEYSGGSNTPANLVLSLANENSLPDVLNVGEVRLNVIGNYSDNDQYVALNATSGKLATWVNAQTVSPPVFTPLIEADYLGSNPQITFINGKRLPQAGVADTVGTSNIVTLPYAYTDASYSVCVSPYTSFSTDTLSAQPIDSNSFSVVGSGSNVKYSWITMPWT